MGFVDTVENSLVVNDFACGNGSGCAFFDCIKEGKEPSFVTPESSAESVALVEKTIEKLIKL